MSHQHRHAGGGGGGGGDCERGAWDAGKRWDPLRLGAFQGYHGADAYHVDDVGVDDESSLTMVMMMMMMMFSRLVAKPFAQLPKGGQGSGGGQGNQWITDSLI